MRTNIDIDDNLLLQAKKLTNIKTKKALVEKALETLIQLETSGQLQGQQRILKMWGKMNLEETAFE